MVYTLFCSSPRLWGILRAIDEEILSYLRERPGASAWENDSAVAPAVERIFLMSSPVDPTAVIAAAARALEADRPDRLVNDRFARQLAEAAGGLDVAGFPSALVDRVRDSNAVRTLFLDQVTQEAVASGIDQVVFLGTGLDSRAWRMNFSPGTTVFRLDVPGTLGFVPWVLGDPLPEMGVERVVDVAADLRGDWSQSLLSAGFDPFRRTLWITEGVLFYLSEDDAQRVPATAAEMCAAGSIFGFAHFGPGAHADDQTGNMASIAEARGAAFSSTIDDPDELLPAATWEIVESTTIAAFGEELDRPLPYCERPGEEVTWLAVARRRG
jgi:methyltransferase (TIGR00027 family)